MSDNTRRLRPDSEKDKETSVESDFQFDLELTAGDRVADRYIVRRLLGQGAMGIVFEAFDEELGATVAVKILRPLLARSPDAQTRFRREVTTARRVTHPNVCRIYDLGHHHDRRSGLDLPFFTMELLEGPTLALWIDDRERLDTTEALELLKGIVGALAAAHDAGVVHRDLKNSNVVIVPDGEGNRPVLTDFGLSRNLHSGSRSPITQQGQVLGTPAFISPEQLRSEPVTHAADIYSLGVMMYKMVTGQLPFLSKNPVATAMIRLHQDPDPPSHHVPDLDRRWEQTILRCLQRDPADRPPNVLVVLAAVDPDLVTSEMSSGEFPLLNPESEAVLPIESPIRRHRWLVLSAVVVVTLLIAWFFRPTAPIQAPQAEPIVVIGEPVTQARPTLAVATLSPLTASEEYAWIGPAVAEMLTTEVAAISSIRPLTREEVALAEHRPDSPGSGLAERLQVDYLVRGTYLVEGDSDSPTLRLDLRLHDLADPQNLRSWTDSSTTDQIIVLMQRLGAGLRKSLGGQPLSAEASQQLADAQPGDQRVARLLTEGHQALLRNDGLAAQRALTAAVDLEPEHPILHAELARAWHELGYDRRALDAANRAEELATGIPRDSQLQIQAQRQAYQGEWSRAAETYDALARYHPDDEGYAVRRTEAWIGAGMAQRADDSLSDLENRFDANSHPRTSLLEAAVATLRSDMPRLEAAAERALALAEERGEPLLAAEARLRAASATRRLGRHDESSTHLELAAAIYRGASNARGLARVLQQEAHLAAARGNNDRAEQLFLEARTTYEAIGTQRGRIESTLALAGLERRRGLHAAARSHYEEAKTIAEEVGYSKGLYDALKGLAILNSIEGDLKKAESGFREALRAARTTGNRGAEAGALNNLAIVLSDRGEARQAEEHYGEALVLFEEIGHLDGEGSALNNLAILQWDRGDLDEATASYTRCIQVYQTLEDGSSLALARANLAEVQRDRGEFGAAAENLEFAIDLQHDLGESLAEAKNRALLAQNQLDLGEIAVAVDLAQRAVEALSGQDSPDDEAVARTVLAKALAASGDLPEARREIERAAAIAERRDNPAIALWVAIEAVQINLPPLASIETPDAAPRLDLEAAATELDLLIEEAENKGILRLELEARLARIRIDRLGGSVRSDELAALTLQARNLGFLRIADLANNPR